MKKSNFFAMLSRMKYINRWGLMRNSRHENISEHTLDAAYITHALCLLSGIDPREAVLHALYHDCSEILTGDLPTPVKYYRKDLEKTYHEIESDAAARLLACIPEELRPDYMPYFSEPDPQIARIIKAADKISALIKCTEELRMGNQDFISARQAQLDYLKAMELPAVQIFLDTFLPAYDLTIDQLQKDI